MAQPQVDYSIAAELAPYVHALFIHESSENPNAWGDGGRALGLGQQHPAMFSEYYREGLRFPWSVTDTWEQAWVKCAANFFNENLKKLGPDKTVMAYNLGVQAVIDGDVNYAYLAAWKKILATLP